MLIFGPSNINACVSTRTYARQRPTRGYTQKWAKEKKMLRLEQFSGGAILQGLKEEGMVDGGGVEWE